MKKIVFLLAAILTLGISVNCFATAGTTAFLNRTVAGEVVIPVTTPRLPLSLKPSANVFFAWGVETTGIAYTLGTQHTSGTFTYGTSSTDTNIYRFQNTVQGTSSDGVTFTVGTSKVPPSSPASSTDTINWSGWTASK